VKESHEVLVSKKMYVDMDYIHAYDVSMQKIQVLFPKPQMERLRRAARMEDRPISEIIRRATEEYLDKAPSASRQDSATSLPVFDGGRTLADTALFRDLAWSDRTGKPA
jgi:hypothetical protein